MRILLDNVNLSSSSGPNSFAKKLKKYLEILNCSFQPKYDVQLSFIQRATLIPELPCVLRLDGIYFNTMQDFENMNKPIRASYDSAESVVFQTVFNKDLIFNYFGAKEKFKIIPNGADLKLISQVDAVRGISAEKYNKVWVTASSWRPHKRLSENIRYFLEHSSEGDCLFVAGDTPQEIKDDKIIYLGSLPYKTLLSLYKRADNFIHLAWLDHCPNVVVDARAAGCKIICSSSGGTKEIAGIDATIIQEDPWDFKPIDLYNPPPLDFKLKQENNHNSEIDMLKVAIEYHEVLNAVKNQ